MEDHSGWFSFPDAHRTEIRTDRRRSFGCSLEPRADTLLTQGCRKLLVVTDHKPLVKILGDRTLDEISNTRIFRIKQRTLPWSFDIVHLPGKTNFAADATSRNPSPSTTAAVHSGLDQAEAALVSSLHGEMKESIALSWETIASETAADSTMCKLLEVVSNGFPGQMKAGLKTAALPPFGFTEMPCMCQMVLFCTTTWLSFHQP